MRNKVLFIALFVVGCLLFAADATQAQTPSPTPAGEEDGAVIIGDYEVTSNVEIGVRGLDVNGNHDKYRSDFNYRPGVRLFDSSFLMEAREGATGRRFFDTLQLTSSGWNADPNGFVKLNIDKVGTYRFDANVRRMNYINRVNNLINVGGDPSWKDVNTNRTYGDFDLYFFPQDPKFRFRLGASFYDVDGVAGFTTRPFGDEFPIERLVDIGATDFRGGVEGKLAGFNLGLTLGLRRFKDYTDYTLFAPHPGLNTTNNARLTGFERIYPIDGDTKYAAFNFQRTEGRLDFTGRFIYSHTNRDFTLNERVFGRDNTNNIVSPDRYFFIGESQRTQSRGDFGITYQITDRFRISNTFSFDQYNITGDSRLAQETISFTPTGVPRPTAFTNTLWYRINGFKRYLNTIEADYQFNNRFGINIGYRFTHRSADIAGFNRPLAPSTAAATLIEEEHDSSTSALLVGMRLKPFNNWSIFADVEHGESENAFTRLSNYNFTNFRVRSNWVYRNLSLNLSAIGRNNENPSQTDPIGALVPAGRLIANVKSRIFSAYADWTPDPRVTLSSGFTYHHLTSSTDIIVPLAALTPGYSQFFMRDAYAFFDISAQPVKRVSLYASYRFNRDKGQGDRFSNQANIIISSYPYTLKMPEIRLAFRITRNIDWNVGYQYYDYKERLENSMFPPIPPNQNYNAHMPYTSLRIYFGRRE